MAENVWLQRMLPYTHVTYRSPKSAHFSVFLSDIMHIRSSMAAERLSRSLAFRSRYSIRFRYQRRLSPALSYSFFKTLPLLSI